MSLARFDLERAIDFVRADISTTLEQKLRPVLVEKYGVGEGSRRLNELLADIGSALQLDVSRYRTTHEYIEALKAKLLGGVFVSKLLYFLKDDEALLRAITEAVDVIKSEAPAGNMAGLIDGIVRVSEAAGSAGREALVSAAFDYLSTVLRNLRFRNLTQAERELAKRMVIYVLRSLEMPIVPVSFLHKKLGFRVSEKEILDLIKDIASYYSEIVFFPPAYVTTEEKLEEIVSKLAQLAKSSATEIDVKTAARYLGLNLPAKVYERLFELASMRDPDVVVRKKFLGGVMLAPVEKVPEKAAERVLKQISESIKALQEALR